VSASVRVTGLDELQAVLKRAAAEVPDRGEKVVSKGALAVKNDARDLITGYAHLPHYPKSIGYDLDREDVMTSVATIGPDKESRQGPLGGILEFGSVNNQPLPHLNPALDFEEPKLADAAGDLGVELLT